MRKLVPFSILFLLAFAGTPPQQAHAATSTIGGTITSQSQHYNYLATNVAWTGSVTMSGTSDWHQFIVVAQDENGNQTAATFGFAPSCGPGTVSHTFSPVEYDGRHKWLCWGIASGDVDYTNPDAGYWEGNTSNDFTLTTI